jgi:hypothetical protein
VRSPNISPNVPSMTDAATLLMWFSLRSPELAEDFERLMTSDQDTVRGSLDTVPEWRLTRPIHVPGQASESADYVLIAEIVNVARWQQQAEQLVQNLEDELGHLVSSRKMLVLGQVL